MLQSFLYYKFVEQEE